MYGLAEESSGAGGSPRLSSAHLKLMSSSTEGRLCAMGQRCTQHGALGQPAKLSRYSVDDICGPCRERERDDQIGDSKNRTHEQAGVDQGNMAPRVTNELREPRGGDAGQVQPLWPPTAEAVLVARGYRSEDVSSKEWRRLCEYYSVNPNAEAIMVPEGVGPGETSPDGTAVCGKPGVAISGYALVCEECWARIQAGEPPRVCEPWDNDRTPPEERYASLLQAAQVLFGAGVMAEEEIVPTLVWAARSWELGLLRELTERFASAGEGSEEWPKLKERFAGALGAFEPVRVVDGVLILRWVPVSVVGVLNEETGATEAITIDVRRRSVKPQDVGRIYSRYLRHKGIDHDSPQGSVGSVASNGVLRLSVRPDEPWVYPMGLSPVHVHSEQLPFPAPRVVESNFRELKGSIAKGKGFGFTLSGREKGGAPQHNATPAICAWYLGNRGKLIEQPSLRPGVARLLNRRLLKPCGRKILVEDTWTSADTLWNTVKVVDPSILRAEHELREAYLALGLVF